MGFLKDCADAFKEGWREAGANMRREQEEDRALRSLDESAREEMRNVNDPCYINLRNRGVNVAALTEARCMSDALQLIKGPCRAALPASAKPSFRLMGWQPLTSRGKVPKKVLEFRLNYEYPTRRYIGARLGYTVDAVLYTANVGRDSKRLHLGRRLSARWGESGHEKAPGFGPEASHAPSYKQRANSKSRRRCLGASRGLLHTHGG